jgi:2,3-bisphosphoglycerate-independent phosphoglycerate mutase
MRCLLFFLDGIGLASADPQVNPFALQEMPALSALLAGRKLVAESFDYLPQHSDRASWLGLDACLGVPGLPQSATGQAALLTGLNIPSRVGKHDGPKPSPEITSYLNNGSLLKTLLQAGHSVALLNAYPPRYFDALRSGYRLPGAIAMAAIQALIPLKTSRDLQDEQALSADFTGQGWHDHLHLPDIPLITSREAGFRIAQLSSSSTFSIFEFWLSDIAGHRQDMQSACTLLSTLDEVIAVLSAAWPDEHGLILITSDHGNLEDLSTRRHTTNPVPLILIGASLLRRRFLAGMGIENPGSVCDLTRVAPAILNFLS